MPSTQNKIVRLYGPWQGMDDRETETSPIEAERCFNVEFDAEEIRTRPGRVRLATGAAGEITAVGEAFGKTVVASHDGLNPHLYTLDESGVLSEVALPGAVSPSDRFDRIHSWVAKHVILTGGFGTPIYYDGSSAAVLGCVSGNDSTYSGYVASLPAAKFGAVYRNRLYLAFDATVFFSEVEGSSTIPGDGSAPLGGANVWPANNNFDTRISGNDQITGMIVFGDMLVIGTYEGLFAWDESSLRAVPGAPGCIAQNSMVVTPKGLCYLSSQGVVRFTGGGTEIISDRMYLTLGQYLNRASFKYAQAVHAPQKQQYRLYLPLRTGPRNRVCVVWDYRDNRWTMYGGTLPWLEPTTGSVEMEVAAVSAIRLGSDEYQVISGDYEGGVWIEDKGSSDHGQDIYSLIAFKRLGAGEDAGVRTWRDVRVEAMATGAAIKVALLPDGASVTTSTAIWPGEAYDKTIVTLIDSQTTWADGGTYTRRSVGADFGANRVWRTWRSPQGVRARTVQPVLVCDGVDAQGNRRGGRMVVRGLEIQWRPRANRRNE